MDSCIIIPCYNEENIIKKTLEDIKKVSKNACIIIVDDGSRDSTYDIVKYNFKDIITLRHKTNLGKGAALKTGCEAALKIGCELIVFIDADGQHPPEAIPEMIKKINEEKLDLVFGSRRIDINKMPFVFYLGNKFLTVIINYFSKVNISDSQSGLKAFKSGIYDKIYWQATDYSVETEIIMNTGKNKVKYGEILIDSIYNDNYKGTTPFDGIKIIFTIIKNKFL